jgi:hypothetical protein
VWTDSWPSIVCAGCGLICVGVGEERVLKVYALQGLRGVETRWPAGSSAGRMVARKARRSHRSEPVQGSGSRPESAHGVCGSSPQNRQVTWLSHKTKTGGSVGGDVIWARREASEQRTRVLIARLASRLSKVRSLGIRPMVLRREFQKCPLGACILVLCNRGSFVFRLSPYILRGEWMAAISLKTLVHLLLLFSLPIFPRFSKGLA